MKIPLQKILGKSQKYPTTKNPRLFDFECLKQGCPTCGPT
jgi:hypothetical protein